PHDEHEANRILLEFALKFLKSVVAYEPHRTAYVAAVTVWDFGDTPLVPNLFVANDVLRTLEDRLVLKPLAAPFGKQLKKLIAGLKAGGDVDVFEDDLTVPNVPRIFIGLAR